MAQQALDLLLLVHDVEGVWLFPMVLAVEPLLIKPNIMQLITLPINFMQALLCPFHTCIFLVVCWQRALHGGLFFAFVYLVLM